jgi:hypothetical protein
MDKLHFIFNRSNIYEAAVVLIRFPKDLTLLVKIQIAPANCLFPAFFLLTSLTFAMQASPAVMFSLLEFPLTVVKIKYTLINLLYANPMV